jgi:natural product precursor
MKSFKKLEELNANNLEAENMKNLFGGTASNGGCTLQTVTVRPSGNTMDGDDPIDGETPCPEAMKATPIADLAKISVSML